MPTDSAGETRVGVAVLRFEHGFGPFLRVVVGVQTAAALVRVALDEGHHEQRVFTEKAVVAAAGAVDAPLQRSGERLAKLAAPIHPDLRNAGESVCEIRLRLDQVTAAAALDGDLPRSDRRGLRARAKPPGKGKNTVLTDRIRLCHAMQMV